VRAELHLYDELDPHVQEAAIRQARAVLRDRYVGGAPVPVRILETFQVREEMSVALPPLGTRPMSLPALPLQWRRYALVGGAILVLALFFWVGNALIGPMGDEVDEPAAVETVAETDPLSGQVVAEEPEPEVQPVSSADVTVVASAVSVDLPPSRNARSDLGIGMRIQVVPGLRVALRSEPGIDRGVVVGEFTDGDVATIVAGPEYSQGDADTIVWWYVTLENDTQAWAAANTSQQTLLMPAQ
jgi:hypothetical protein